ncbi:MAG: 16S rRNA (uracil(1498)-N(3))-methyltransferase [Pirellulales bacterium]
MVDRYFVDEPIAGTQATLRGSEAHHLMHVMRAKPGEVVSLFDGSGAEYLARVAEVTRERVGLEIVERRELDREAPVRVTLAVALPKGDRQRWLAEKAVELGVWRLIALESSRSISKPSDGALERLRRAVIEASKQCGRNRLMEIATAKWSMFLNLVPSSATRYIAHPAAATPPQMPTSQPAAAPLVSSDSDQAQVEIVVAIGPEGGFTEAELAEAVSRGWQPLNLGPRVLRVETAAVAAATLAGLGCLASPGES